VQRTWVTITESSMNGEFDDDNEHEHEKKLNCGDPTTDAFSLGLGVAQWNALAYNGVYGVAM